jgi:bacterioferritin-associated ferredoxin
VSLARTIDPQTAEVILPHEYMLSFVPGDLIEVTDVDGNQLEKAEVVSLRFNKKYKTHLVTVKMSLKNAHKAIGIRVQGPEITGHCHETILPKLPDNGIVCRCERVTVKELVDFIKEYRVRDINQLKQIRAGMGACGSKTCSVLYPRIFKQAGVDFCEVSQGTIRPVTVEVPMNSLIDTEGK